MKTDYEQVKQRLSTLVSRYKYILLMILVGAGLMLFPSGGKEADHAAIQSQTEESSYSLNETQQHMEKILSRIDGVGRAEVMLTVSSGSQFIYQEDQEVSYSGTANAPEDYTSQTGTVLLDRGSIGQEALQTQEIYPPYVGALVVCDGAGNSGTTLKVKEAVSVLTGLGADRISVVKRSES